MQMIVDFPGGARVDAHFGSYAIQTDQPPSGGGEGAFPTPFATFLASIATCAGIYVLGFCRQRGLPTEDVRLVQDLKVDPVSGMVAEVGLEIQVPPDFPEKYRPALIRAAEQCAVKKHLEHPPSFAIRTTTAENLPA
jgi:putative redox protein